MSRTTEWMDRHLALAFAEGDTIHAFVLDTASWEEASLALERPLQGRADRDQQQGRAHRGAPDEHLEDVSPR